MFRILHKKGLMKKILWVITIAIILSFGFAGSMNLISTRGKSNYAGIMFGKKISLEEFKNQFNVVQLQAFIQYNKDFEKIKQHLDLTTETWDRMILIHEANKQNINATNDEIIENIKSQYQFFQEDGKFNQNKYEMILKNYFHIQPRSFEESIRDNLKIAKLFQKETEYIVLTDDEIFNEYKEQNEKIKVSYYKINTDDYKNEIQINENELRKYYDENKDLFIVPPQINVQYIKIDLPEQPRNEDEVSQEEMTEIEKQIETARNTSIEIYSTLIDSNDIVKVAEQYKIILTTSGFFSMKNPNLSLGWSYEFLNKLFSTKEGEIIEPFETPSSIIIAKLLKKKDSYVADFNEAKDQASDELKALKAKKIARTKAEEILSKFKDEFNKSKLLDFAKTAKTLGFEFEQTPVFGRGQYLPNIGISKEFQENAFSMLNSDKKISDVIEVAKGFCFLHVDSYIQVDEKAFQKDKKDFAEKLFEQRKHVAFSDFLTRLRLQSNLVDNISKMQEQSDQETQR